MKSPIKKKTLLSLVSVMLCLIMLAGTAYAYFEYRVTNYGNKITIGGIAAELLKYDETSSQYQDISNGTAGIFNDVTMQAGNTEIVYLQVKNTGTLPLYYDLVLNVSVKNGNELADLSPVLKYAVAEGVEAPVETALSWDNFAFPVGMTNGKHMPIVGNALAVGGSEYLALAVNLAEGDNNYAGYTIEIDAEVVAKDSSSDLLNGDGDFEGEVTYVNDITGGTWVVNTNSNKDASVGIVSGTEEAPSPSGTKYLQQAGNGSVAAYVRYGTEIPVTPGKTYRIDYKIKMDNASIKGNGDERPVTFQAFVYDAEGGTKDTSLAIVNTYAESQAQWIAKTGTVTIPEGGSHVIIRFTGNAAIRFNVDDIKFYEVTATE